MIAAAAPRVPPRLVRDALVRGVVAWAVIHVALAMVAPFVSGGLAMGPLLSAGLVALTAGVVAADVRISRETLLFANLGVPRRRVALWAAAPAALLETVWLVALAVLR